MTGAHDLYAQHIQQLVASSVRMTCYAPVFLNDSFTDGVDCVAKFDLTGETLAKRVRVAIAGSQTGFVEAALLYEGEWRGYATPPDRSLLQVVPFGDKYPAKDTLVFVSATIDGRNAFVESPPFFLGQVIDAMRSFHEAGQSELLLGDVEDFTLEDARTFGRTHPQLVRAAGDTIGVFCTAPRRPPSLYLGNAQVFCSPNYARRPGASECDANLISQG